MKAKTQQLIHDYRAYHTKMGTVLTHLIGVPLVTLSLMIVLGWFEITLRGVVGLNALLISTLLLMVYYWLLDAVIGTLTNILLIILCLIASIIDMHGISSASLWIFTATFVLGWAFQLVGHAIEGRKPALLDHFFASVFIAPFFIMAEIRYGFTWPEKK